MKTDTLWSLQEDVLLAVMQTARRLESLGLEAFHAQKLHPAQFNILNLLAKADGEMEQAKLLEQVVANAASITVVLARLAKRGLIESRGRPEDRRCKQLHLTAAGRKVWVSARRHYEQTVEEIFKGLTKVELLQTSELLEKLSQRANEGRHAARQRRPEA
jgi:DNA-binding MarR family transcriptional regulator